MVRKFCFLFFFSVAITAAQPAGPGNIFAGPPEAVGTAKPCVAELRIGKATNPFRAWDSQMAGWQGRPGRAVDLKGGDYEAVPPLGPYGTAGHGLMGIDRKTQEPVVSSRYFSPLARVDATRIEPGQEKEIGTFLAISLRPVTLRDIVLFLLESQVVTTYWHVESILCLVSEDNSAGLYKARFQGKHIYYTNRYNEEKLNFFLTVDTTSGRMVLLGGGP